MLVKVGVYCLRGGNGHWACYDDPDAAMCGTKGPDVYIDVDTDDMHMYPPWLQSVAREFVDGDQEPDYGYDEPDTRTEHDESL